MSESPDDNWFSKKQFRFRESRTRAAPSLKDRNVLERGNYYCSDLGGASENDGSTCLYDGLTSALQNKNERTRGIRPKIPVWGKKVISPPVEWISPA